MRILILNESADTSGGGRNQYVADVAVRLREAGHDVGLVHSRRSGKRFKGVGYVFDCLGFDAGMSAVTRDRLDAILTDFEPEIIQLHDMENIALEETLRAAAPVVRFVHNHTFYCSAGSMTLRVPRKICTRPHGPACLRCHVVNRCGSLNPSENLARYRRVSRLLRSLRGLDGIQVASEVILENLVRNGIAREAIAWIPLYAPAPQAPRRPYLRVARRVLLHPGGLVRNKGVWMLLHRIHRLPPDVELVFTGDGPERRAVESHVRRKGLGERVRVLGALEGAALSELFHQASLVLFPSRWNEPVGLCGIQAMAHGRPIVAYDAGGVRSWLEDGHNGRLIPLDDAHAYMDAVNHLLANPGTASEMGRAGRRLWEQRFRPALHIESLIAFYQSTIRRRGG